MMTKSNNTKGDEAEATWRILDADGDGVLRVLYV